MRCYRLPATRQWSNFNGGCFLCGELLLSSQPVAIIVFYTITIFGSSVLFNDSVEILTGLCSTWKPPTSTALSN